MDYSNIQTVLGLATKAYANADDDTVGPVIDLAGFRKAWVQVTMGACGANGAVLILFSDSAAGPFAATDALNHVIATTDTVQSSYMDVPMQKRYMQLFYNHSGAAEIHNLGASVLLGCPDTTELVTHVPNYVEEAHGRN